ncbi:ferric reductase transmembrane component, putative [Coccidioides posadasii C735 delta SOWgp]|uniref:Ferric reductase transmembrane component, putative n=1 Tax=Coccidioides posadasii (strain C735) TaxID=222929 RepID=C5PAP0_COCP7|nr:ferric reductase transmembrane component, putative [Coccidioides posadasii C735 delta SOWgp]EER26802.1 ferric reductase transmembrane component, putative [Coccidioides posadasii C735 delta SOWgp]|eukprot:XP_003068947.1 ferric reductase transmembrane component, putative [Coccidioides posadasii C735 delta SOWgp]
MDSAPHGTNTTYISDYTRGLTGVNVRFDHLLTQILCVSIGGVAVLVLFARIAQLGHSYLRRVLSSVTPPRQQRFWGIEESQIWPNIKKHILYAPLGRKRHNREFQLSTAVNVGTLPSRFHTILLTLYIGSQLAYCIILDYSVNKKAALVAEVRGRTGNLAVLNMIPLIILSGRNNPLIPLLRVSFDTYNLLHRWIGRVVALEAIAHTLAWAINAVDATGWDSMWRGLREDSFYTWGLVSTVALAFLFVHSPSPLRHAFYETFLHLHQVGALVAMLGLYLHLDLDKLPQVPWMRFIIGVWILDRCARFIRLIYLNVSRRRGLTRVVAKALPGEATRVTFFLPNNARIEPGSHVYAYLPRISYWMSHPFSVAWVEKDERSDSDSDSALSEKTLASSSAADFKSSQIKEFDEELNGSKFRPTRVTLIMAARTGMTRKLYNAALASPNLTLETSGFIEGPYNSRPSSSFGSYGTVVLFSGGAGITHHLLQVKHLLEAAEAGTVATRKIYLVWGVRTTEHLSWVRGFMDSILHQPNRRDILITKLFISKPKSTREITSPSTTLQMFPGRCRPNIVLDEAMESRVGATVVSVCGPGSFADEVRASVRGRIGKGVVIDFVEESFTW